MKQRLQLTWLGEDGRRTGEFPRTLPPRPQPRLRILSADGPERSDADGAGPEASLSVCGGPRCRCLHIFMDFPPQSGHPHIEFWFDLNRKRALLSPEQERDVECARRAALLHSELTDADQQQLREWYLAEKMEIIRTTPVSHIDIDGLPNADDGRMVGFVEVFPLGLALNFVLDREAWAVDDHHCVQRDCGCHETVLSFLKLKDAAGRVTTQLRDMPALRYNYRSQRSEPVAAGPPGAPPLENLLSALRQTHASLDGQLDQRHRILQALYLRREIQQNQDRIESLSARLPRKVGRNEPCPCGSGRKYKHCCLNKNQS